MAESHPTQESDPIILTVSAVPYDFAFEIPTAALVIIDMRRGFLEAGGFGETFGYNAAALRTSIAPTRRVLDTARALGMMVRRTSVVNAGIASAVLGPSYPQGSPRQGLTRCYCIRVSATARAMVLSCDTSKYENAGLGFTSRQ